MTLERRSRLHVTGKINWAMALGWVIAALLAANLVWGGAHSDAGTPQGFISDEVVRSVLFWGPIAFLAFAAASGIWLAQKIYKRREKSSVLWTRHGFVFGCAAAVVLSITGLDEKNFPREWFVPVAAIVAGAQVGIFAYATFREYRRTVGTGHRSGRSGSGGVQAEPDPEHDHDHDDDPTDDTPEHR